MHSRAPLLAAFLLFSACSFEGKPLPLINTDGPQVSDTSPDLASDRGTDVTTVSDRGVDLQVDAGDPRCAGMGTSYFCDMDADPALGRVSHCELNQLIGDRYCFAEAPCNPDGWRRCQPAGCNSCFTGACKGVCTLFRENMGTIRTCCVTANEKNGQGLAQQSCSTNSQCKSGLCTSKGNCFQACRMESPGSGDCPEGWTCQPVQVVIAGHPEDVSGCVAIATDGGPAPQ